MSVLKIAIADSDQNACKLMVGYIRFKKNLEIVGTCANGKDAVQLIHEKNPNVLAMELTIENSDTLLSYIQQKSGNLEVLAFLRTNGHAIMPVSSTWSGRTCNEMETQLNDLTECIRNVLEPASVGENERIMELRVSTLLRQFGVPAHIKGYQYLRTAIIAVTKNAEIMSSVTKILYPEIARLYDTNPS